MDTPHAPAPEPLPAPSRRAARGAHALAVAIAASAAAFPAVQSDAAEPVGVALATADASMLPGQRVEVPWTAGPALRGEAPRTTLEIDTRPGSGNALQPPAADAPPPSASWAEPGRDPGRLGVRLVRWAPAGRAGAVGLSVGFSGGLQSPSAAGVDPLARAPQPVQPELGVRWRSGWSGTHRVDVAAWRSAGAPATDGTPATQAALYNARVELQFRDAKRALGFDLPQGAFGLQLQGGAHLLLRARHGGPMLYYRRQW
jgi:hypothetical protein